MHTARKEHSSSAIAALEVSEALVPLLRQNAPKLGRRAELFKSSADDDGGFMSAKPASMETDSSNADETPTNAPPPPPADDDDELRFEEADEDAETPPSTEDIKMDIPKNLRDSLGSGSRDAAPAGFTSTKRARKATARFADLEAKGQSYSQAEDDAASSPRPPPRKKKAPPKATTEKKPKRPRAPPAPPTVKRPRNFEERVPATAEQLQGLSIKELKALADKRKVDLTGCAEKGDLLRLLGIPV